MFVLVLAAEADETRQAITFLIVCLVGIAVLLSLLTAWYWQFTSPERRSEHLLTDLNHYEQTGAVVAAGELSEVMVDGAPRSVLAGVAPSVDDGNRPPMVAQFPAQRIEVPERAAGRPLTAEARIEVANRLGPPAPPEQPERPTTANKPMAGPKQQFVTTGAADSTSASPPRARTAGPKAGSVASSCESSTTNTSDGADGLSDEDWAAVMKSAFDKLHQ